MKRIFILGATGILGKALVSKLTDSDRYALTLAARHATQHYRDSGNIKVTDCDASSVEELSKVMPGMMLWCAPYRAINFRLLPARLLRR